MGQAPADTEHFDLLIIGAGSGNTIPGPELSGWRIGIVDDGRWFGGTCLNAGCIPTKMFVHPGEVVAQARHAAALGVTGAGEIGLDWDAVRDRVFGRIDAISESGERYREHGEQNITLVRESVHFVAQRDDGTFLLDSDSGRHLEARRVVIAAGSRPRALPAVPFSSRVITSDDALRLAERPRRVTVIGGGAVATEFAAIFHAFGADVDQINRSPLLRRGDSDISTAMTERASEQWNLHIGTQVVESEERADGVRLHLDSGEQLDTDLVLVAVGRVPNSDRIAANAIRLDLHDDGRLAVDAYQRVLRDGSPVPGLWALGDIDSAHQLKHVANEEARIVAANLRATEAGEPLRENSLSPVPEAVFGSPESASFGPTLAQAREAGHDAVEVRMPFGDTAWGWALEDTTSFLKLVVDRGRDTLLGAHLIGPLSPSLIQPLVMAASRGLPVTGLARSMYWPHPAPTEVVENALLRAEEELTA